MGLLYRPTHPYADESGFISKEDYYNFKFMTEPDLRMFVGNEPVKLRFISDALDRPTRHPCDSKLYESKSKFRKTTKAFGCVEVGNDTAPLFKPKKYIPPTSRKETREAIRHSIRQLSDGTMPEGDRAQVRKVSEQINFQNRNRKRKS